MTAVTAATASVTEGTGPDPTASVASSACTGSTASSVGDGLELSRLRALAASVTDPEMPMLTLADLGVLRDVRVRADGTVVVTITPTYSGCPAMATMRDDLVHRLTDAGVERVEVVVSLHPAWSSDWISEAGRAALRRHGISAPGPARRPDGPIPLTLGPVHRDLVCPRCGSAAVSLTSEFGPTSCKALYRCTACLEPFEHVKEI
ncbi:1,2-phenylacetyl-CoA epoxidase subunit PaaD [Terracoccus luteus]|uniref:Ring-1,2-phenylacetyl-CoA epoxidase subunit PaaD n=1 Tax=Terracoccus luteus TaxID=53356 RepID=A0A495XTI8_9MICO|nr:1,2-phenylacetyl-CoA epoxidase subunit PaaD [Terracoccus luteus]MBB2986859.1 ring-1,2-phenylacetyl-CoA epoxidase subunit PaaD [Terracoccus luteus]MCP2172510.1 ring-1,2-phenylacetyl-CoA epoxidase subunit PaaD [Terracoccus luteus]RKT76909.1 ring-1,2-phenylacetyl-CoA epoxidase subunit PaaD [Terracoccus luteus]